MDQLLYGFSKEKQISITFVDVSDTAKTLERKHLSGPTAGRFLGEALAAVALLSANLGNKDERVSLQFQVDGPMGGCLVDASQEGNLRGYTHQKILNNFDGQEENELNEVLGNNGALTLIKSNAKQVLYQQRILCSPPNIRFGLARYYNEQENKPTAVEISASSENHYLNRAVGIMMSRMPEGTPEDFVPLLEKFNDKTILNAIKHSVDIKQLSNLLGLTDLEILENRPLTFKCSCSHEKVVHSVTSLGLEELKEILEKGEEPEVTCHFCSTSYKIKKPELVQIIRKLTDNKENSDKE